MSVADPLRRALLTGTALVGGAILAEALGPREAQAAMTVFDPSNLAKNAETAAQTAQLVLSNKGILKFSEDILKKIGLEGIGEDIAGTLFNASGGRDALGHIKKIEGAGRLLALQIGRGIDAPASVDSVQGGLALAAKYAADAVSAGGLGPAAEAGARQRADTVRLAQVETLGAALYHSDDTTQVAGRVANLAQQARKAAGAEGDLRGQVAVLTTAVLAQIEEAAKGRQLMAALAAQLALEGQFSGVVPDGRNAERKPQAESAASKIFGK